MSIFLGDLVFPLLSHESFVLIFHLLQLVPLHMLLFQVIYLIFQLRLGVHQPSHEVDLVFAVLFLIQQVLLRLVKMKNLRIHITTLLNLIIMNPLFNPHL